MLFIKTLKKVIY